MFDTVDQGTRIRYCRIWLVLLTYILNEISDYSWKKRVMMPKCWKPLFQNVLNYLLALIFNSSWNVCKHVLIYLVFVCYFVICHNMKNWMCSQLELQFTHDAKALPCGPSSTLQGCIFWGSSLSKNWMWLQRSFHIAMVKSCKNYDNAWCCSCYNRNHLCVKQNRTSCLKICQQSDNKKENNIDQIVLSV